MKERSLTNNESYNWDSDYVGYTWGGRELSQSRYLVEDYWPSGTTRIKKPIQSKAFMQEKPISQKERIFMRK